MHEIQQFLQSKYKIDEIVPINKGFSNDHKYKVSLTDGKKLLVRVSDQKSIQRKKEEFEILTTVYRLGVTCSEPLHFHVLHSGNVCMVLSYLEGEDGEEALQKYSDADQYRMGIEAGKQLKILHSIPAPINMQNWYEQKWMKHMSYYEAYKTCGYTFNHAESIQRFIEEKSELLKNRPSTFQHDDFHPSNIIIHEDRYSGVIDFNRYDWGDPYHDFYKVGLFTSNVSVPFAVGQLHGYFDYNVPSDFWDIYTVYMGMSIFSSIVWSLKQHPSILDSMIGNLHQIMNDHNGFTSSIPAWYKQWRGFDNL